MDRISVIRESEKQYHDYCYQQHQLFEEGSWLHKPVKTVLELLPLLAQKNKPAVLDLGAGVGRNSIPLAKQLGSRVVCVDLLDSALEGLKNYSRKYKVEHLIEPVKADLDNYFITPNQYDLIIAISSIEHTSSEANFDQLLKSMIKGTKCGGMHCLVVNSDIVEYDIDSEVELEPMMELNFSAEYLLDKFDHFYQGWLVRKKDIKQLEFEIARDNRKILLRTKAITYVVTNAN
ncbi:class I SAM-dependent methyltransferase [Gracilibacillus oryzae]|uniref:Class I SAM-dependent methyltransferase n=1 Tax=Gracilibacillus oryzae TaxID=1672701 RepID=A0A7C8GT05_9BACI|nr:class I SAM-dependent methyltransferase [Gracilibacillus oryzae]KAB8134704.1 class I SAM-dependent methyltransferase [Gracilibacillus oryzae]